MVSQIPQTDITYPESDGKPVADNTRQFRWIVVIQQNLDALFASDPNVFVAGDLLWYPVEGRNTIVTAPDVMIVFGRPKGERGSYKQWEEANQPPQVVFEILSPSNTQREMERKLLFYDRHGVEEYYIYDPDRAELSGWLRQEDGLEAIDQLQDWISPRLNIRFDGSGDELQLYRPDGQKFAAFAEIEQQLVQERRRAEQEHQRAEQERQRAEDLSAQLQRYRDRFGDLPE